VAGKWWPRSPRILRRGCGCTGQADCLDRRGQPGGGRTDLAPCRHTALPATLLAHLSARWMPLMTDPARVPQARARAAIGRAMGRLGLDRRPGVGLRADGLPDIDWVNRALSPSSTRMPSTRACPPSRSPDTRSPTPSSRPSSTPGATRMNAGGKGLKSRSQCRPVGRTQLAPGERQLVRGLASCRWLSAATGARFLYPPRCNGSGPRGLRRAGIPLGAV
jgi:hypothetical protein